MASGLSARGPVNTVVLQQSSNDLVTARIDLALVERGFCGGGTSVECSSYCKCELETCRRSLGDPGELHGYCYVDAANGDPALVASCPASQRQILRFLGNDVPRRQSIAFLACPED